MIEVHCHLINGIDDGSKNEEMTLNMIKIAKENGVTKIICTPHYYPGRFEYKKNQVEEKINKLREIAIENNLNMEFFFGQEVFLDNNILENYSNRNIGTINNSRYMLIEMNFIEFEESFLDNLYELSLKGVIPIIAHPERYKYFIKDKKLINNFFEIGCLFQLNAGSLTGQFGKDVQKLAKEFLENDIYNFIGSDAHSDGKRRCNLKEVYEILNLKTKERFLDSSEKLIKNQDIVFEGQMITKKKGIFSFLKN